jgi:outer membrane protein assembly factor BamB
MSRLFTLLVAGLLSTAAFAADWPAFRGPHGNGVSEETKAPLEWSKDQNIKWKAALPQPGNGSPIVSKGVVFVTCAEDPKGHERSLYAFDRKSGDKLWVKTVEFKKDEPTHDTNPHGGSTPAANGKVVVVWHASAGLYCYDFAGQELWKKDLGEFRHMWGYGTSPVIHNDRVILHSGPGKEIFVGAYALADGAELWKTIEPQEGNGQQRAKDKAPTGSWSTPALMELGGKQQAIVTLPTRVASFDVANGKELWSCQGIRGPKGDLAYSSPVIEGDLCVMTGGYGGPAIGFKLGGEGDVTEDQRLWRTDPNPQSIGSGVMVDGYLYRPNAGPNTIQCIDPKTGEAKWTERAGSFWGSFILAAGRIYGTSQDGTTHVFKPSPEKYESLAKNPLGEPSNATPALSDGEFFIRTHKNLYCIGE